MRDDQKKKEYQLTWEYDSRVASEHLGSRHYSTASKALCELITNAFDADASRFEIELHENTLGVVDSLMLRDDGVGISPKTLQERFMRVGIEPDENAVFGKLGIGRLAVLRIGHLSKWRSVSMTGDGKTVCVKFNITDDLKQDLSITEGPVETSSGTGTTIEIVNLRDLSSSSLSTTRIRSDLLRQFCSYLLANKSKKIIIDGSALDVEDVVVMKKKESVPPFDEVTTKTNILHVILNTPVERTAFKNQLIFSAHGRTITCCDPEETLNPNYLGVIDCPYLEEIVLSNREALIQLDSGFSKLKSKVSKAASVFNQNYFAREKKSFIERARQKDYYPYKSAPDSVINSVKRDIYDVVLEKVHEQVNVEVLSQKQQAVVFKLLRRVLESDDMLEVLSEIATLSDDDVEKFRKVLERTTLTSILRLSSEVTARLEFLNVLHKLVYGDISKLVKERKNLHKIIEAHCWIFHSKYHLATSDQSFREVIRKHRSKANLSNITDDEIAQIDGIENIPDLFLAAQRDYPVDPKHHHLLVELKAPSVPLGRKEVEQIRRYRDVIFESHEFDKESTFWDIYLVSSKASGAVEKDRHQKNLEHGIVWQGENMNVWAFEWSEIITKAKEEMSLVRDHLETKTKELSVSEYLRKDFPDILNDIEERKLLKGIV